MTEKASPSPDFSFSLVDDPLLRIQRLLRLAPRDGLGVVRRAVFFAVVSWVPIVVWAGVTGHLYGGISAEPLVRHFSVHVRCLLAIPLMIVADVIAARILGLVIPHFVSSGLVPEKSHERFREILRAAERLRDSRLAWLAILALIVSNLVTGSVRGAETDAMNWAVNGGALGFGGLWFIFVARTLFLLFATVWLWRLAVLIVLCRRLAGMGLDLAPAHPDHAGGLGFLNILPVAFSAVVLAISCVVASSAAHAVLYHDAPFTTFKSVAGAAVVILSLLFLAPLFTFSGPLRRIRIRARLEYGSLAGRHARAVHARWIEGAAIADAPFLDAPELGPAADVATLYQLATSIRVVPIGKTALGAVLIPAAVPLLIVAALEVPLKDVLLKLLGALV